MRALVLATLFSLTAAAAAFAADMTAPVKVVMDITAGNWAESEGEAEYRDLFDEAQLGRLYSRDFVEKYRAAAKFPAYDEGTSPFDYDVIAGGQDGCPLKDVTIEQKGQEGAATEVDATFKNRTCFGDDAEYQQAATVKFMVVEESGKPVIDDILTQGGDDAAYGSLKDTMAEIARLGQGG